MDANRVRLTFRVVLARPLAEALAAEAIRREMNLPQLVTELLTISAAEIRG